jgi:hypothetical protein
MSAKFASWTHSDGADLDQLEQRHERHDDLHARAWRAHDIREPELALLGHRAREQRHHVLDVEALGLRPRRPARRACAP